MHPLALSDQEGFGELFFPWIGAGGASLCAGVARVQGDSGTLKSERVPISTIDAFCEKHGIETIDFLKLDIKG